MPFLLRYAWVPSSSAGVPCSIASLSVREPMPAPAHQRRGATSDEERNAEPAPATSCTATSRPVTAAGDASMSTQQPEASWQNTARGSHSFAEVCFAYC